MIEFRELSVRGKAIYGVVLLVILFTVLTAQTPVVGVPGGGGAWGSITGALADQTDLNSALAAKAALASPAFTGNPTAPTQSAGDNSTKVATTSYADRAAGSGGSVVAYTTDHTLVSGDCGNWLTFNGSSLTLTLASPPISSTCQFAVQNLGSSTLTISRNGLTINGASSNVTISAASGAIAGEQACWTNGTNYFCSAGVPGPEGPQGPTGPSGGAGGLSLVEEHTASASSSLNFTSCITSTYDDYQVEIVGLTMGTGDAGINLLVSTDGGSTYATSSYRSIVLAQSGSGAILSSTSAMLLTNSQRDATNYNFSTTIKMFDPGSSINKGMTTHGVGQGNDGNVYLYTGMSFYASTSPINAFQIKATTGNLATGSVRCYGLAK